jgi:small subunit ribosomal protein S16
MGAGDFVGAVSWTCLGRVYGFRRGFMAVVIRLSRVGAKNSPCFRIVATDSRTPRDGRSLEILGTYDPRRDEPVQRLDMDRVEWWLAHGATMSETVRSLVRNQRKAAAETPADA